MAKNGDIEYIFVCMDYNESEKYIGEYGTFSGFYQCKFFSVKDGSEIFQPVANWGVTETQARFFCPKSLVDVKIIRYMDTGGSSV